MCSMACLLNKSSQQISTTATNVISLHQISFRENDNHETMDLVIFPRVLGWGRVPVRLVFSLLICFLSFQLLNFLSSSLSSVDGLDFECRHPPLYFIFSWFLRVKETDTSKIAHILVNKNKCIGAGEIVQQGRSVPCNDWPGFGLWYPIWFSEHRQEWAPGAQSQ